MHRFKTRWPVAVIAAVACLMLIVGFTQRKQVTILDEDREWTISTLRTDVSSVLKAADVTLGTYDKVEPSLETPLSDGMVIEVFRADTHEITVDGGVETFSTTVQMVEDIIKDSGITLGQNDIVYPGRNVEVSGPTDIEIIRVTEEQVETEVDVPYNTIIEISKDLEAGQSQCVQEGQNGKKEQLYRVIYENGMEIRRELVSETVLVEPVPEKVIRGQENLYVTSRGRPLRYKKVIVMRATAYDLSYQSCGKYPDHPQYGLTYTGTHARPGVVAVDQRVIKLGSKLYVESMDRMADYGFASAEDTGSAIKGNKIDLFISDHRQAVNYGVRTVKVYVLEEPVSEDMLVGYSRK